LCGSAKKYLRIPFACFSSNNSQVAPSDMATTLRGLAFAEGDAL
jgi:hypothetical protein